MSFITDKSLNEYKFPGDINAENGQFGQSVNAILPIAKITLNLTPSVGDFDRFYYRYFIDPSLVGANTNLTLPNINTALYDSNLVQVGWTVLISNNGTVNNVIIKEGSTSSTLITLTPGNSILVSAQQDNGAAADDWVVIPFAGGGSSSETLQDVYDNSVLAGEFGDINLDGTNGIDVINGLDTISGSLFNVSGTNNILNIKNIVGSSFTPTIEMLSAISSGNNSVSIGKGASNSGNNAILANLLDLSVTSAFSDTMTVLSDGGLRLFKGETLSGTDDNDASLQTLQEKGVTNGVVPLHLLVYLTNINTAYTIKFQIIGARRSGSGSIGDSWRYDGKIKIKNIAGTLRVSPLEKTFSQDIIGTNVVFNVIGASFYCDITGIVGYNITWTGTFWISDYKFAV